MSFKKDHPAYKSYESNTYYVKDLPGNISSALQGFVLRHCSNTGALKSAINDIAGRIPIEPTTDWSWDFLVGNISFYTNKLCNGPMHKVMDFLAWLGTDLDVDSDELNELLDDLCIGYNIEVDSFSGAIWHLKEEVSMRGDAIESTTELVKDICTQTLDHLEQAKDHLLNTKTDRDRKDAIRDCVSAMEAMLKNVSGEAEIKLATTKLKSSGLWGHDTVVKDGLSIWDHIHRTYPDVRHGNPDKSSLSDDEAIYWAERITCFIRYIAKTYKRNGG